MSEVNLAKIDRLVKGTERNCSDQRRNDTRSFIADALTTTRELHGHIAAMTADMAALEKQNRNLERMLSDARGQEEDASNEVMELYEVVICQAKRITELVEAAK